MESLLVARYWANRIRETFPGDTAWEDTAQLLDEGFVLTVLQREPKAPVATVAHPQKPDLSLHERFYRDMLADLLRISQ